MGGTFAREDFRYDHGSDTYTCPAGKTLITTGTLVNEGATLLYRGTLWIAAHASSSASASEPRCSSLT